MTYYRPEWTCGRYHKESRHALMYNLFEGIVFLFQDETADLIGEVLKTKKGNKIDLANISKNLEFDIEDIKNFFNEELLNNKLVTNKQLTDEEVFSIRKNVYENKKKNFVEKRELNFKPYIFDDAQDDYRLILQKNNIPFNVTFELTYNCNERCIHCYNPGAARNSHEANNRKLEELTTDDYKRLISELKNQGVVRVTITGGDPFMRKDIWEIIEMLYDNDFAIDIKTNGLRLLGHEEKLAQFYPLEVSLSVYSGIDETHDGITKVKGSLQKTEKCIANLCNWGVNVKIGCIIMKPNAKNYYTASDIAKKFALKIEYDLKLINAFDGDISVPKNLQVRDEQLEVILRDERVTLYVGKNAANGGKIIKNIETSVCGAGLNLFGINPEGNVMPCHAFPMSFGNIKVNTFSEIINSENTLKWKEKSALKHFEICGKEEYCSYCNFCVGDNFLESNTPYKPNAIGCYIAKVRMKIAEDLNNDKDLLNGKSIEERLNEFEIKEMNEFNKEFIQALTPSRI